MIAASLLSASLLSCGLWLAPPPPTEDKPEEMDELEALQIVLRHAVDKVSDSVVTITTRGGIRKVEIPDALKQRMTTPNSPERPREGDPGAPRKREDKGGDDEESQKPEQKRYKNEWEKMLAYPGFKKAEGPTTGIVLSKDGYILTSAWNFESKPNVVLVTLNRGGRQETHVGTLLGVDRAAGLALLKIPATDLAVPEFIDPDEVRVGSWACALGRAIARERPEIKYGVISAKDRIEGKALQTDAATSPTNYGGPLIDKRGRIYGIIVPLGARGQEASVNWYDSGIGFAVPVPDPDELIERLGKEGTVLEPAFLGVQMNQDRTKPGALVTKAVEGMPAAKAGLKDGDVILEIDGKQVLNSFTLRFAVGRRRAGDEVKLVVLRGEERVELTVTLGKRPKRENVGKIPIPMPDGRRRPGRDRDKPPG